MFLFDSFRMIIVTTATLANHINCQTKIGIPSPKLFAIFATFPFGLKTTSEIIMTKEEVPKKISKARLQISSKRVDFHRIKAATIVTDKDTMQSLKSVSYTISLIPSRVNSPKGNHRIWLTSMQTAVVFNSSWVKRSLAKPR